VAATENLFKEFGSKFHFMVIYTLEAHPCGVNSPYANREWTMRASWDAAGNPLGQPETYAARMAMARQCVKELGVSIPVLVDSMENAVWCAYGGAPNNAYFIAQDGRISAKHGWYQPAGMELTLLNYLR